MSAALAAAALLAAAFASPASAYGGGASHDTWQVGLSFNCTNPSYFMCQDPDTGLPQLGGFWGWIEFDRFADGTITGDAQLTGCGHTTGGGGFAGAFHEDVDITSAHLGPAQPGDPNFGTPGAQVFYIDGASDPQFLGDSGFPTQPGHYSFHPVPVSPQTSRSPSGRRRSRCSACSPWAATRQPKESAGSLRNEF